MQFSLSVRQLIIPLLVQVFLIALAASSAVQVWKNQEQAMQQLAEQVREAAITQTLRHYVETSMQEPTGEAEQTLADKKALVSIRLQSLAQVLRTQNKGAQAQKVEDALDELELTEAEDPLDAEAFDRYLVRLLPSLPTIELKPLEQQLADRRSWSLASLGLVGLSLFGLGLILAVFTLRHLMLLYRGLEESTRLQLAVQERERQRIAQDLHDGAIQELIVLKRNFDPERVDHVIAEIRRLCHNLKPSILEDLGLVAGLNALMSEVRQAGLQVSFQLEAKEAINALPNEYSLPLYRALQELLTNVHKHAEASSLQVRLLYMPEESPMLRLHVVDDGVGFACEQEAKAGLGLVGVKERIQALGGKVSWQLARPNEAKPGTRVEITVPVANLVKP